MSAWVPAEINDPRPGGIFVLGRDPGGDEMAYRRDAEAEKDYPNGRPFVGLAGQELESVIPFLGMRRSDLNIGNVVGTQPPANEFKAHNPADAQRGLQELDILLKRLKPRLIIALGNEANYALNSTVWPSNGRGIYGSKGINDRRGYFWETPYGWVLSALHPAGALRKPVPGHFLLENDFRRARKWLSGKLPREALPGPARLSPFAVAQLVHSRFVGWDIETKWDNNAMLCFAPEQRALKADGSWSTVANLQVGDKLIGFDEHPDHHGHRQQRVATVEGVEEDVGDLVEIVTTKGALVVTLDHRLLCKAKKKSRTWKTAGSLRVSKGPNNALLSFLFGPNETTGFDPFLVGRLSGLLDGEGYVSKKDSLIVGAITQLNNGILARTKKEVEQLGFRVAEYTQKVKGAHSLVIRGGSTEALRYLCVVRPEKISKLLQMSSLGRVSLSSAGVLGIIHRGKGRVIRVRTSTKTLIVEGFAVHNCSGYCGDDLVPYVASYPRDFETFGRQILTHPVPKCGHNGSNFDLPACKLFLNLEVNNYKHDTQHMWWALEPELAGQEESGAEEYESLTGGGSRMTRKALAVLPTIYDFNVPWWKDYPSSDDPDHLRKMMQICAVDVWVTKQLGEGMLAEIQEQRVQAQYDLSMRMIPATSLVHLRGLRVNKAMREERIKKLQERSTKGELESIAIALEYIRTNDLEFFRDLRQCECCGGGTLQRAHCWACNTRDRFTAYIGTEGVTKEIAKALEYKSMKALREDLNQCDTCAGTGKIKEHHFNPFSTQQLQALLYDQLGCPKSYTKKKTVADEFALRKILRWANV